MKTVRDLLCVLILVSGLLTCRAPALAQFRTTERSEWETEATGYGVTMRDAERDAVEVACDRLREHLTVTYPNLTWTPDPSYLWRKSLVHLKGNPVKKTLDRGGTLETLHQVTLELRLTAADLQQIEQRNREQIVQDRSLRSVDRHRLLALIVVGAAAALVLLKLYLWLEEATRGYSTGLLRAAALILLGLVIAVLIWVA